MTMNWVTIVNRTPVSPPGGLMFSGPVHNPTLPPYTEFLAVYSCSFKARQQREKWMRRDECERSKPRGPLNVNHVAFLRATSADGKFPKDIRKVQTLQNCSPSAGAD